MMFRPRGGGGGGPRPQGGGGGFRVYVGNLDWSVSWQDLKDHMRTVGNVKHVDIMERADGKSKGCAIVVFDNADSGNRAIQELTDTDLNGRNIFVREDREPAGMGVGGGYQQQQQQQGYNQYNQFAEKPAYKSGSFVAQKIRSTMPAENQIYIGNLPWSVKWQDLKDLCAQYGEVVRADVAEEATGRSKGFGTVVFSSGEEADACIAGMNEMEHEGRQLVVRSDSKAVESKVYVGNLPWSASWQELKDMGKEYGEVSHADVIYEPNGRSKGFGIITFAEADEAAACIAGLNGQEYQGRQLAVKMDGGDFA